MKFCKGPKVWKKSLIFYQAVANVLKGKTSNSLQTFRLLNDLTGIGFDYVY